MASPSIIAKANPTPVDAEVVVRTATAGSRSRSSSRRSNTPIYYISKMMIQVTPEPEKGTVTIVETISYRHFQTVDRHSRSHVCLHGNMRLEYIKCLEDGNVQVLKQKREGESLKVYFGFHATDQYRTFEMKYVIDEGISRDSTTFEDILQLVCLDGKWETTIRVFEIQVILPKGVAILDKVVKISEGGVSSLTEDRRGTNQLYFIRENIPERLPIVAKLSWIDHKMYRNLPAAQQQSILSNLSNRDDGTAAAQATRFLRMSSREASTPTDGAESQQQSPSHSHSHSHSHPHPQNTKTNTGSLKSCENGSESNHTGTHHQNRRASPALSPPNPGVVPPSALKRSPSAERVEYRPKSPQTSWRANATAQANTPARDHWWVPRSRPSSASSVSSLGSQRSRTQGAPRTVTFVPNS